MKMAAIQKLAGSLVLLVTNASPQPSSPLAPPPFVDVTEASNVAYRVGYTRPYLVRGQRAVTEATYGGAAAGDCDKDGDIDLFITYGNTGGPDGGGGPNRLYLNQLAERGNGLLFIDIAEEAGVANTRPDGKNNDRHSGPAFADMDGDGDLDMFLTHWATRDRIYFGAGNVRLRETDHLWRNEADASGIRFVNVSEETGISNLIWRTRGRDFYVWPQDADFTFTATFARVNDDLWPDIAIAADFGTTQLAINNGDGTFRRLEDAILRDAQFGMGSALGDFDNDGDLDWFVSSILGPGDDSIDLKPWGNRLFTNDGSGFIDDTARLGVADGSWGWGACFLDIDNDSDLDIYLTNGWSEPYLGHQVWQTPAARAFVKSAAGTYDEEAAALGLAEATSGRGVVCADFDHDGDTDILELTNASGNSARLWENRTAAASHPGQTLVIRYPELP
jgi:hypothetical protein